MLQGRVSSECPAGSSIRKISVLGNVTCETDTDTQLSEAELDAFMADFALSNYRCKGDEYQEGTQSDGTPYCHKKTFANGFYPFIPQHAWSGRSREERARTRMSWSDTLRTTTSSWM